MPVVKTYKCELGLCALINSCGGLKGQVGDKLAYVEEKANGLVVERTEYHECARFREKNFHRKGGNPKWKVRKAYTNCQKKLEPS